MATSCVTCVLRFWLVFSLSFAAARRYSPRSSFTRRSLMGTIAFANAASASATTPGVAALQRTKGIFPDCPAANTCVSSQDDRPQAWDNPWDADDEPVKAMARLQKVIVDKLKGTIVEADDRYLRAEFTSSGFGGTDIDDAEFYFAPNDTLIQFRAERRGDKRNDFGANRKRLEQMRISLGYDKVPVLRNRRRALVVVESPLDSFGPGMYERDDMGFTARDMVPAESNQKEIYGELDPLAAPWSKPTTQMKQLKATELGEKLGEMWTRESDDRVRSK